MEGRRIEVLCELSGEQDLEIVKEYMQTSPIVQALSPKYRSHWYETHLAHARKYGTNVSEQLVITQEMADFLDDTNRAEGLQNQLTELAHQLFGSGPDNPDIVG